MFQIEFIFLIDLLNLTSTEYPRMLAEMIDEFSFLNLDLEIELLLEKKQIFNG